MSELHVAPTADLPPADLRELRALLEDAFAGGFSDDDWDHALGGVHALVTVGGRLVAHAAVVPRRIQVGERVLSSGYVEAVATAPTARRRGHATRAMRAAEDVIRGAYELGVLSTGCHRFYERLGWERWRGPTSVLRRGERVRTADEDDTIMVLRFGPSEAIALDDPIACGTRSGDDW